MTGVGGDEDVEGLPLRDGEGFEADAEGDDAEGATDASHANDLGFMRQADVMEPILRAALRR